MMWYNVMSHGMIERTYVLLTSFIWVQTTVVNYVIRYDVMWCYVMFTLSSSFVLITLPWYHAISYSYISIPSHPSQPFHFLHFTSLRNFSLPYLSASYSLIFTTSFSLPLPLPYVLITLIHPPSLHEHQVEVDLQLIRFPSTIFFLPIKPFYYFMIIPHYKNHFYFFLLCSYQIYSFHIYFNYFLKIILFMFCTVSLILILH
jgi:hypothetical protein